jgi:phage terminase large subunit-like protein
MTPATARFYDMVMNRTLTHTGDPALAQHLANALLKTDARGSRLTKDSKHSTRRIDLAVAAVMALDRAAHHAQRPRARLIPLASVIDPRDNPNPIPPNH